MWKVAAAVAGLLRAFWQQPPLLLASPFCLLSIIHRCQTSMCSEFFYTLYFRSLVYPCWKL